MKPSTLALVTVFALSSTFAFAQNSSSGGGSAAPAAAPTTGASTHGTTQGQSMPGAKAGVQKGITDGAQPAGNADNSGGAVPSPSSRISPGQKNEEK
jgi:hypothetical protein